MIYKKKKSVYIILVNIILLYSLCSCSKTVVNPEILKISTSSVSIAWKSSRPYEGNVSYYPAGKKDQVQKTLEKFSHSYRHEVQIDGLKAGTQYIYWINDNDEVKYFFRTEPPDVKAFSFLIVINDIPDRISNLLISEMPEFVLLFSKNISGEKNYLQSIKPYAPLYGLTGQKSNYIKPGDSSDSPAEFWKLDYGGLTLAFINERSGLDGFTSGSSIHTTGVVIAESNWDFSEQKIRSSPVHKKIINHNNIFPSNKISFVFVPGDKIEKKEINKISYLQIPLMEKDVPKKNAVIRIDVNVETTYAVMLDTKKEMILKSPPLKKDRTCVECRRLASTGAYKESVAAYREFIKNNRGHYQIDDAYYSIADILDTKLFKFRKAVEWYRKLSSEYPRSTLTPLAKQRLEYISRYSDYDYVPLNRFEQIRRVEFLQKKNKKDKEKVLEKAYKIIKEYSDAAIVPVIYYWLANQYRTIDMNESKELYLSLLKKYPEHPYAKDAWWEIGETYYDAKKFDMAIDAYTKALKGKHSASEDIKAQIHRAKRNLRRKHFNYISWIVLLALIVSAVFIPAAGIVLKELLKGLILFVAMLCVFLFSSWLIKEQFSSAGELFIIASGAAASFSLGFPFSFILSNKILNLIKIDFHENKIFAAAAGIILNLIFAVCIFYLTLYHTNEHFLIIWGL